MVFVVGDNLHRRRISVATCAIAVLPVVMFVAALMTQAGAATITLNTPDSYGRVFIDIFGDLTDDDVKTFRDSVTGIANSDLDKVIVSLNSTGGVATAVEIGDIIRLSGMKTYVAPSGTCESVCAFIWLAGSPRFAGPNAQIGFHGAYEAATGLPGQFNVIIATYLGYLHFSYGAVAWMLMPPPMAMHVLTDETAKQYGISFVSLEPPRLVSMTLPSPPLPPKIQSSATPSQPASAPQPPQAEPGAKRPFRVVSDDGYLNIRKGPGSTYDVITTMRSGETGTAGRCVPVGGNYLPFCEVEWQGITGWASSCCIVYTDQSSSNLSFFCIPESGRGRNPQDDGIIVQATEARAGWSLHVVHKVGGQLYDRNVQYEVSAFRQDQNRPSYYWDGVLTKDRNVLMTGHLWLNAGVWLYNEYISFRDGSQPVKLATPPVRCQPSG